MGKNNLSCFLPRIFPTKNIFHFSGSKVCSWYDFAKIIVKLYIKKNIKFKKIIIPISSNQLISKVNRPKYSVLNNKKFFNFFKFKKCKLEDNIRKVI